MSREALPQFAVIFFVVPLMVDKARQLPSPEGPGWSIDLAAVDGPRFVVMRCDQGEAREALAEHLVEIGAVANTTTRAPGFGAPISSMAVIW